MQVGVLNTIAKKVELQLKMTEKEDARANEEEELSQYTNVVDVITALRAEEEQIKQAAEAQRAAALAECETVRQQLRKAEDVGDEEAEGRLDARKTVLRACTRNDCREMREEEERRRSRGGEDYSQQQSPFFLLMFLFLLLRILSTVIHYY